MSLAERTDSTVPTKGSRWRLRRKSHKNRQDDPARPMGSDISHPAMFFGQIPAAQSSSIDLRFARERKLSTGGVTIMDQKTPIPVVQEAAQSSVSLVEKPKSILTSFQRHRKSSAAAAKNTAQTAPESPSFSTDKHGFFRVPRKSSSALVSQPDQQFTTQQAAMQPSASIVRQKKVSFNLPFTRTRNRPTSDSEINVDIEPPRASVIPKAMESSSSLVDNTPKKPSFKQVFRNRKRSTTEQVAPSLEGQPKNRASEAQPTPKVNAFSAPRNPPKIQAQETVESSESGLTPVPKQVGRRKKSLRLPAFKSKATDKIVVSGEPTVQAGISTALNPRAPEFIPQRAIPTSTAPDDALNYIQPGPLQSIFTPSSTLVGRTSSNSPLRGGRIISPASTASANSRQAQLTACIDPKSLYVPPHRRKNMTATGLFLKPLVSTIPFPSSDREASPPANEPETDNHIDKVGFNIPTGSKYRIYKNLLDVIWTETESQNNTQIQQDIVRQIATLNHDVSVLASALESQQYLLQVRIK
ncbi:hypothetical protein C8R43DRAFT_514746 [Mycena crocata]|nr:hypothetical protein C8R43DRAFT_514746 [Mycena crocata]